MNWLKNKKFVQWSLGLTSVTMAFILFGQGCGESMKAVNGNVGSLGGTCDGSAATNIVDKNVVVTPGTRTVSISYGQQLLDSLVACTGLGSPSQRTLDEWTTRNQSLSEYGLLTDVSGAMMMAVAAVSAEVCKDLIEKEKPLMISNRSIFRTVAFTGNGLSQTEITDSADLLALSCWQRPVTDEEKNAMINAMSQLNTNSENGALSLCTAMLSSLAAIEQ